jgi:HTH-type transcriptional regulator/antitoxin MqsA
MSNRTCEMCDQGLLIKTNVIDNVDFKDKVLRVHSAFTMQFLWMY